MLNLKQTGAQSIMKTEKTITVSGFVSDGAQLVLSKSLRLSSNSSPSTERDHFQADSE